MHTNNNRFLCLVKSNPVKLETSCTVIPSPTVSVLWFMFTSFQSDDFHLDRTLFFACKDDREQFCKNVLAGEGRVYECLIQNKRVRFKQLL